MPSVMGKRTEDAVKALKDQGFDVQIQDSVYTDTAKNGIVLKQLPDANSTVKVNRTVFLTVNRVVPPMIDMPKLKDLSLNFALDMLERNHLKLEDTIYKTDFQKGAVLDQQFNGISIAPGAKVRWGSRITLIVGSGLGEEMLVPDVVGLSYGQAKAQLEQLGIIVVPVPWGVISDTASAFVVKQNPPHMNDEHRLMYIQPGQFMDLNISATADNPFDSSKKEIPTLKKGKEKDKDKTNEY